MKDTWETASEERKLAWLVRATGGTVVADGKVYPAFGKDINARLERLLVTMDEVERKYVKWLWRDRIPLRAVTLLAGIGGLGKSQASLTIAAEATRSELTGRPESVLLFTAEDDLETVVKPRLSATNADDSLVVALRQNAELWLPDGLEDLRSMVAVTHVKLIIFDPLLAYVDAVSDTHKERDVRVLIRTLHEIAAEFDAAVLAIMHFKKGNENDALYRVSGAAGFGNAARSVLAAARDPHDEKLRVLVHVKNNYGIEQPTLRSPSSRPTTRPTWSSEMTPPNGRRPRCSALNRRTVRHYSGRRPRTSSVANSSPTVTAGWRCPSSRRSGRTPDSAPSTP